MAKTRGTRLLMRWSDVPESERGPKEFHRAATSGLWRENFSDEEQAVLHEVLGPKLRQLGYEPAA